MKRLSILLSLIYSLWFTISLAPAKVVERIVARVNNDVIFQSELDNYLRFVRSQTTLEDRVPTEGGWDEIKKRILDQMVEEKILLQEAKKEEIEVTDEEVKTAYQNLRDKFPTKEEFNKEISRQGLTEVELKENLRKQLNILKLIEKNVKRKIQVTSKDVKEYYLKHKDEIKKSEEEAREEITNLIFDKKFNEIFSRWMKKLKERAVIEINL